MVMGWIRKTADAIGKGDARGVFSAIADPFDIGSAIDPTRVQKADTSRVTGMAGEMVKKGGDLLGTGSIRYNPTRVQADNIQGQRIGNVQGMGSMAQAVNAAQRNAQTAGQMDPQTAAFLQAAQQSGQYSPQAIQMMQQAAMGQGPSAAQAQLQAGTDQAIKAQMAAAGSRGFSAAGMRGAQMQGAEMQQQAVNQATMLRAQEQQAAQQQFLQASLQQEEMQRQAALQAAGINLEQDLGSQQARQAAINAQAAAAGQFAGLGLEQASQNAQLAQQASLANQAANLRAGMFNSQLGLDAWSAGMGQQLARQQLGASIMNPALSAFLGEAQLRQGAYNQSSQAKSQMIGGVFGGLGEAAPMIAAASDRKAKKNIKPNKETMAFLNALTDNSYEYKEPNKPGRAFGRQYGPMAQDLEKTAMGKTAVIHDEEGTKRVDPARGFLLALSGLANVNKRLAALEAK